jgi:hypothetical protein
MIGGLVNSQHERRILGRRNSNDSQQTVSMRRALACTLVKGLKAARLDNSYAAELRKLLRVDLLIIDDFALQALGLFRRVGRADIAVESLMRAYASLERDWEPNEQLSIEPNFLELVSDELAEAHDARGDATTAAQICDQRMTRWFSYTTSVGATAVGKEPAEYTDPRVA